MEIARQMTCWMVIDKEEEMAMDKGGKNRASLLNGRCTDMAMGNQDTTERKETEPEKVEGNLSLKRM